jgi:hypothetical protein
MGAWVLANYGYDVFKIKRSARRSAQLAEKIGRRGGAPGVLCSFFEFYVV